MKVKMEVTFYKQEIVAKCFCDHMVITSLLFHFQQCMKSNFA